MSAVSVFTFACVFAWGLSACGGTSPSPVAPVSLEGRERSTQEASPEDSEEEPELPERVLDGGLVVRDLRLGEGALAETGSKVKVHYVGTLPDGREFDNSHDRGKPFEFSIGRGEVIRGWEEGVRGMRVGGVRRLRVPADLAYGDSGAGEKIPPRATLIFQIELLDIAR